MCNTYFVVRFTWFWFWQCTLCIQWRGNAYTKCMVSLFRLRLMRVQVRHVTDRWLAVASACLAGRGRRFFFLQTRIAIPQYFSQSYGAYFKHIVRTCTCAYTYCKYLRDVNDILRHIKIRAIWLAEMQSSFAEKKITRGHGPAARGQSVHGSVYCAYKWGMSQTDDSPSLIGAACLAGRGRRFFFCKRGLPSPNISANHMARILSTSYVHVHMCAYTYCKCLRDVNDILRHFKIRAIWLAEMQSSFAEEKNRARARCTWSVCSRLRLLRVQVRRVTDRWLTIAYRLNSMTNNVVSLFTAPFTVRTIVRRVTDQWLAIDKSTTSYPNEVFIIHAIRRGLDLKVRSTYCGKERETAIPLMYGRRAYHL